MKKRIDKCLAEGEVTGHFHVAVAKDVEVFGEGIDRELNAPTGTDIVHEEHKTITLPPGQFTIKRQREIDPEDAEIRFVKD